MTAKVVEVLTGRTGAERGALASAAGAIFMLLLTVAVPPVRLVSLVGPSPMPQALALIAVAAAMSMGAEVGRRAARYRASRVRRLLVLVVWTFLAFLGSVTAGVVVLILLSEGPGTLADPFLLVVRGLVVCLLLLPWAALPILTTGAALERWTRSAPAPRRPGGGPGGPKGGTHAERPLPAAADSAPERRRGAA